MISKEDGPIQLSLTHINRVYFGDCDMTYAAGWLLPAVPTYEARCTHSEKMQLLPLFAWKCNPSYMHHSQLLGSIWCIRNHITLSELYKRTLEKSSTAETQAVLIPGFSASVCAWSSKITFFSPVLPVLLANLRDIIGWTFGLPLHLVLERYWKHYCIIRHILHILHR